MASTVDPELARRLNLPARTWYNYETGVTVPAEVLLGFIEQTGVNPTWLLNGEGPRYRQANHDRLISDLTPVELIRRGLEELERSSRDDRCSSPTKTSPGDEASEFVAIAIYPSRRNCRAGSGPAPRSKDTCWRTGTGSPIPGTRSAFG